LNSRFVIRYQSFNVITPSTHGTLAVL
jgi:hypothetical protein